MDGDQTAPTALSFLSKENPLSLYNSVNQVFREHLDRIPDEIWTVVQENEYMPHSQVDVRLKLKLWETYALARGKSTKELINGAEIAEGICHYSTVRLIIRDPKRLAWLFTPPKDYEATISAAQELWLARLFEILSLPIKDANTGKLNLTAARLVLQAGMAVDLRKHGSPLMRTEQKSLNVNVDANKALPASLEDIDKKLAELEQAVMNDGHLPVPPKGAIIDADFTEVEE